MLVALVDKEGVVEDGARDIPRVEQLEAAVF